FELPAEETDSALAQMRLDDEDRIAVAAVVEFDLLSFRQRQRDQDEMLQTQAAFRDDLTIHLEGVAELLAECDAGQRTSRICNGIARHDAEEARQARKTRGFTSKQRLPQEAIDLLRRGSAVP